MNISSTEAGSPSPVYSRPVDVEAYYAFLLEAIDRFPREGVWIRPNPFYPLWRSHKPAAQVLRASFDRLAKERRPKIVTEFGVHKGISIRGIARALPDASIYGFDSFEGFPADGRNDWKKDFSVPKLPDVPANARLVKGFFGDTLPAFRQELGDRAIDVAHIDCDIYSSTVDIFTCIGDALRPGTVIVFDELFHYPLFPENEFLAFYQFLEARNLSFEWFVKTGKLRSFADFCREDNHGRMIEFRRRGYYQNVAVRLKAADPSVADRQQKFAEEARRLAAERPLRR